MKPAIEPGTMVYINGSRDLGFDGSVKHFITRLCRVIRVTKAGLVQVHLADNPKDVASLPFHNIDIADFDYRNPGTQQPVEDYLIPAPNYEIYDSDIESTISLLLDHAIAIGERHSQNMIAAGRGPTPFAHHATVQYHAIEAIRRLQAKLKAAEDTIEALHLEQTGEDS